jgi:glutamate formiminotransferase
MGGEHETSALEVREERAESTDTGRGPHGRRRSGGRVAAATSHRGSGLIQRPPELFEAVPNFSEGRDQQLIAELAGASAPGGRLLDVHPDPDHNRVVITLAGADPGQLVEHLVARIAVAVDRIDLRRHAGVHPRQGAADVVPIVPLGSATMAAAVRAARALAERIWLDLRVPVHLYGEASLRDSQKRLADVRAGRMPPDFGTGSHPTAGVISVGARAPLVAYNVVLERARPAEAAALARALRESSGGSTGLQALAFELGDGRIQLSMNLVRLDVMTPARALEEVRRRADEQGITVGPEEIVGLCPAAAATRAADGRLLEARLAAAAAAAAGTRLAEAADAEGRRLAERLQRESRQLSRLPAVQESLLEATERALALARILRAARVEDEELQVMLAVAAGGLLAALSEETRARHPKRLALLVGGAPPTNGEPGD